MDKERNFEKKVGKKRKNNIPKKLYDPVGPAYLNNSGILFCSVARMFHFKSHLNGPYFCVFSMVFA